MKKRLVSSMLAAGVLFNSSVVLADIGDHYLKTKLDEAKYTSSEVLKSTEVQTDILHNNDKFAYEGLDGKIYAMEDVNEAYGKYGETDFPKFLEELKKYTPLNEKDEDLVVESVSAINSTQAEVEFNMPVKEVKPANFKVTDKDGNLAFVSKVELNNAKDVATLTFFDAFADKGEYTVEVSKVEDAEGNVMETATEKFEYVKADVAKVEFTSTTVAPKSNLKDAVKVTDKLGRDITEEVELKFESSNEGVITKDGEVKEGTSGESVIVVAKVGKVKTAATTIKVSDAEETTFVGFDIYEGSKQANDTDAFEKLDADKITTHVSMDDTDKKLALYYKDQYGKSMDARPENGNELEVTNVTPTVVIVENDGEIKPISAGEGYVKVKANDNLEHTIKIVVREEAKIATMEVEKTELQVVEEKSEDVKVTFKDQFGDKKDETPEVKSEDTDVATVKATENKVTVTGEKEGTTTIEVSYKVGETTLKETIEVTVVEASDLAKYEAKVDATKLDVDGNNDDKDELPVSTTVVVNEIDTNGNNLGEVTSGVTLVEVDKDGTEVEEDELVTINGLEVIAKEAGTAYVEVKVGSLVIDTLEFEIVDTEEKATSVVFDRNDLVFEGLTIKEDGSVVVAEGSDENDLNAKLKEIIKVLDQDGKEYTLADGENLEIDFSTTNAKGLEVDKDGKITEITSAKPTVDVVVTEVKVGEDGDNLLEAPTTVKVAVKVEEQEADVELTSAAQKEDSNIKYVPAGKYLSTNFEFGTEVSDKTFKDGSANLVVELWKDETKLATNKLLKSGFNNQNLTSPFSYGQEETRDLWAWNRGAYTATKSITTEDSEKEVYVQPNKIKVSYTINGIDYSKTFTVQDNLDDVEVPTAE